MLKLNVSHGERGFSRGQIKASYQLSADRHSSLPQMDLDDVNRYYAGPLYSTGYRRTLGKLVRGIREDHRMNKDIFLGKWKQLRGQLKVAWGKLTDDDMDKVAGNYDKLVGLLQERYGYTREQAEAEVDRQTAEHAPTQNK
jgi:uncharacterized protein YjbJ (UPF0337 family)